MDDKEIYVPEVNDYVIWDQGEYGHDEGWVYWKGDPVNNEERAKYGWRLLQNYITIETGVRRKPKCEYERLTRNQHKYIHTLVCCFEHQWHQLKFVKRRKSKHDQEVVHESDHMYWSEPKQNHNRES